MPIVMLQKHELGIGWVGEKLWNISKKNPWKSLIKSRLLKFALSSMILSGFNNHDFIRLLNSTSSSVRQKQGKYT